MPDQRQPPQQPDERDATEPAADSGEGTARNAGEQPRQPVPPPRVGPSGEPVRDLSPAESKRMNRRELLKLVPVVALGAFAIPKWQQPLLDEGYAFSDWASGKLFGRHRLARTFSNNEVAPLERFPYNYYDVLYPDIDLSTWTLTVEGLVQHSGDYKLEQIQ